MIRKILKSKWSLVVMLATMLLLIWSRTFIGIANGCGTTALEILGHCTLTVFLTFIWGCNLYVWDDETGFFYKDEEEPGVLESFLMRLLEGENYHRKPVHSSGLRNSLCVILALAVICLLSFALSDWTDRLNLFSDSKYMQIGWLCINKKYIYDVLAVIVFPIWTTFIIRKMKESEFTTGAVLSGIMQILTLTLIGFLLYMGKSNIWLIEMVVLNVITLILAVHGYAWKNIRKKGNAIALLIMYALLWILLISVFRYSGQSFAGFMGFTDITQATSYFSNVHKIAENAPFIGQNSTLLNDPYVISFMKDSHYLIPSVLFYGGWLPTILLIFVEVVFIVALAGVLIQAREHDGRDIMLDMIWVGFLIRVIAGLLYSFGLPTAILLPFSGTTGIITDSICMGILLMGYLNRKRKLWCGLYEFCDLYEDDFEGWEGDEYEKDE
ncbi:MAG TPA: hypothetical protein IAA26_14270 [Candidatus Blautia faecipullorum]|nr:hypothetical protein [Candidatus Blautia faecipullorum]